MKNRGLKQTLEDSALSRAPKKSPSSFGCYYSNLPRPQEYHAQQPHNYWFLQLLVAWNI